MSILDPETIITTGGLALIAFIVFAESGLLFGFFFPGDTLLFLAGTLAAQGQFSIYTVVPVIMISAILGGQVGYSIGNRAGPKLFKKKDGILFRHEYIERSEVFYKKHGGKTILLARFVPIVRTFAPVVAGMGNMDRRRFAFYNIAGSALWGAGVTILGYFLGQYIPDIDKYILPIVGGVMILSFGPAVYHILKDPKSRGLLTVKFRKFFLRR
ncbi:MAG: DedA family protein [Candidatus Saccharimonadales bacterium]